VEALDTVENLGTSGQFVNRGSGRETLEDIVVLPP